MTSQVEPLVAGLGEDFFRERHGRGVLPRPLTRRRRGPPWCGRHRAPAGRLSGVRPTVGDMAKALRPANAPRYRCSGVRVDRAASGSAAAASARPGAPSSDAGGPDGADDRGRPGDARRPGRSREVDVEAARAATDRRRRARPGARRRPGAAARSCCWPASRASASRRCCSTSRRGPPSTRPHALRHRRGVRRPGAAAGRPHRRAARRPVPRRRDRPRRGARPHRRGRSPTCWSSTPCRPIAQRRGRRRRRATSARSARSRRALIRVAKERGIATVLVGHVTKDGVDRRAARCSSTWSTSCCTSRATGTRGCGWSAAVKNRYGPADEVGCFDLADDGIVGLADPSGLFLSQRAEAGARHLRHGHRRGQAAAGRRGAGAASRQSPLASPRRTTSGLDVGPRRDGARGARSGAARSSVGRPGRLRRDGRRRPAAPSRRPTSRSRSPSPARQQNAPLATGLVAIGEVGLAGEIRRVTGLDRRLAEAARLGFTHALVPPDPGRVPPGIQAIEVADLDQALRVAFPGAAVMPFASRRR